MVWPFGWIISILFSLIPLCGLALLFEENTLYYRLPNFSPLVQIGYGAFHRSVFALSFAWIIFACTRQYGGKFQFYKQINYFIFKQVWLFEIIDFILFYYCIQVFWIVSCLGKCSSHWVNFVTLLISSTPILCESILPTRKHRLISMKVKYLLET